MDENQNKSQTMERDIADNPSQADITNMETVETKIPADINEQNNEDAETETSFFARQFSSISYRTWTVSPFTNDISHQEIYDIYKDGIVRCRAFLNGGEDAASKKQVRCPQEDAWRLYTSLADIIHHCDGVEIRLEQTHTEATIDIDGETIRLSGGIAADGRSIGSEIEDFLEKLRRNF